MEQQRYGSGSSRMNPTGYYCSKVETEENHFQWRIENFRETIENKPSEYFSDSVKWSVEVGESLGGGGRGSKKWRFGFQLEKSPPRPQTDSSIVRRLLLQQGVTAAAAAGRPQAGQLTQRQLLELNAWEARATATAAARNNRIRVQGGEEGGGRQNPAGVVGVGGTAEEEEEDSSYCILICQLELEEPLGANNNNAPPLSSMQLQMHIRMRSGDDYYFDSELEPEMEIPRGRGWVIPRIFDTTPEGLEQLLLVDEALILEIKLSVSKRDEAADDGTRRHNFGTSSSTTAATTTLVPKIISMAEGGYSDTVTLSCSGGGVGSEGEVETIITSSKAVLSARSSTLAGMFLRNPSQDKFKLDNMSSATFNTLLQYLHTGELPIQGFSSASQVLDVAAAAQQYGLPELFHYCDAILAPSFCSMETASALLCKSREGRLFKSAQAIMDYISTHSAAGAGPSGNSVVERAWNTASKTSQETDRPGIMNHNYTLKETVTTGVRKEVYPFTWEIQNFKQAVKRLHPHAAKFDNTRITGCYWKSDETNKWKLTVYGTEEEQQQKRLKIRIRCECLTSGAVEVEPTKEELMLRPRYYLRVEFQLPNRNRWIKRTSLKPVRQYSDKKFIFNNDYTPLEPGSGNLTLKLQLVVLTNQFGNNVNGSSVMKPCTVFPAFCKDAAEKLERDMESLYKVHPGFADVTIISKEGHQLFAHWRFLAERCAAFKSMFESGMKEVQFGVITLPDVPRNAVDIMLGFIYTGRIPTERFVTAADILDVAHVAEKYDLEELKSYCDEHLVEKCNLSNASELLAGATMYRLAKANSAIQKFIESHAAGTGLEYADLVAGGL